jgi:endonuclease V-like protein UPF0215 family
MLSLDDGSFTRKDKRALVVGIIGRERIIEGVLSFFVDVDGTDSTVKLISAIKKSRFSGQIKVIVLNGVSFGGLNIIDTYTLHKKLDIPVIALTRSRPRVSMLKKVIAEHDANSKEKLFVLKRMAKSVLLEKKNGFYAQIFGRLPEYDIYSYASDFLRLAHIVATGVTRGESKGRF